MAGTTRTAPDGDGYALAYERAGTGGPVLLLHGWPGDRGDWAAVAHLLAEAGTADVVWPDLRAFGESDKHGGDVAAAGQARSLLALLDELGIERAVVAGYDVGSRVAQTLATEHPDRVAALVLAPPLPGAGRRVLEPGAAAEFWYQHFHRLGLPEHLVDGRPGAVRAYLRHFWDHWSGPGFTVEEERLDRLTESYSPPGAFTASIGWYRSGSGMIARSLAEEPPSSRITVPTTVLWPEHDPLFPRAWSDRLDDWFEKVELRPLDGVGHFSPVEAPERWAEVLAEVVAGVNAGLPG
ncbi:alpha/beta hydrolase [Pseudonocardia sp. RS11V-5]|uniref:alpha/beta fold hydrolase n=1 Tax=Pseudonocardia terrae TaxID=2905831 RepID=UPI001E34A887|nr:alpha/beta hydrolase [Pseudonocardia terrae]MCE3552145.1 alpha/beta hydrolase [Pseudonocardia terrae]